VKLTTITQVSVDGVMQGPGANPVRDDVGVFERRGWAHFDDEAGAVMDEVFQPRRRVPVRQEDLRALRRDLGKLGRSGRQPDLDGVEHCCPSTWYRPR
jgi:hypothetical protein